MPGLESIYADFNGLQESPRTAGFIALYLHYYGSLVDLARARIRLCKGLEINVYSDSDETEDLEATGTVYFDEKAEQWFAEFPETNIRYVPTHTFSSSTRFPCWKCGAELQDQVDADGLEFGDKCPVCHEEIHAPVKPPDA